MGSIDIFTADFQGLDDDSLVMTQQISNWAFLTDKLQHKQPDHAAQFSCTACIRMLVYITINARHEHVYQRC